VSERAVKSLAYGIVVRDELDSRFAYLFNGIAHVISRSRWSRNPTTQPKRRASRAAVTSPA
jgi:hypothetical protein